MAALSFSVTVCRIAIVALIVSTLLSSYAEARYDCYAPCKDCPNCNKWCKQQGYTKGGRCHPKDGGGDVVFCCCDRVDVRKLLVVSASDAHALQ